MSSLNVAACTNRDQTPQFTKSRPFPHQHVDPQPMEQAPTRLERYAESNILTLFRYHMPMQDENHHGTVHANFNFSPMFESAARICKKIDLFDDNEGLLDQVIYGIVNPYLCDPGVKGFTKDRKLIALLLVRHFKKFGGLVLMLLVRQAQNAFAQEPAAGRQPGSGRGGGSGRAGRGGGY